MSAMSTPMARMTASHSTPTSPTSTLIAYPISPGSCHQTTVPTTRAGPSSTPNTILGRLAIQRFSPFLVDTLRSIPRNHTS